MTTLFHPTSAVMQGQNDLQKAIHRTHWEEREGIIDVLAAGAYKADVKRAYSMAACGQTARLFLDPERGKVAAVLTRCGHRLCPWCTHHRTAEAKRKILAVMATMKDPRTIVLTARSNDRPLAEQLRKLRTDFNRLRHSKRWKDRVTGGVYTLEVTYNPRAMTWHPHVHLIVDGTYFPQPLLSSLWKKATGDSDIVWIQKVTSGQTAAMELAGYIGKPPKIKDMPAAKLLEYFHATRGLRMLQTFGACRSTPAEDNDKLKPPPPSDKSISVNRIRFLARKGQAQARELADLVADRWPIYQLYFHPELGRAPPPGTAPPTRDIELLDAAIFIRFTLLLQAATSGELDVYDIYDQL